MHIVTQVKSFSSSTIPDRIMFIEPNTQFDQKELAQLVSHIREQYRPRLFHPGNYDKHVERRLRNLDWTVQDELYKLIRDRTENSSNSFRRREYKLVVLLEVPGGEMTDARIDSRRNKLKRSNAPHIEYRVILRGHEVMDSADGWGAYDRYTQPWKLADEAVSENARRKCGHQEILE